MKRLICVLVLAGAVAARDAGAEEHSRPDKCSGVASALATCEDQLVALAKACQKDPPQALPSTTEQCGDCAPCPATAIPCAHTPHGDKCGTHKFWKLQ